MVVLCEDTSSGDRMAYLTDMVRPELVAVEACDLSTNNVGGRPS